MKGIFGVVYNVFMKRTVTYVPLLLVGAYYANEATDLVLDGVWERRNKGKLFHHLEITPAE